MQSPPHSITLLKLSLGRSASPRHASGILYPFPGRGSSRLYRQRIVACASSLPSAVDLTTSAAVVCLSCFFPVSRWRWASAVLWSVGRCPLPTPLYNRRPLFFPVARKKFFAVVCRSRWRCRSRLGLGGRLLRSPVARCGCSLHPHITASRWFSRMFSKKYLFIFNEYLTMGFVFRV